MFAIGRWRLLRVAGLICGVVVIVVVVLWVIRVKGLSSQKGCSGLVVRNFDREGSRERRLELEGLEGRRKVERSPGRTAHLVVVMKAWCGWKQS